MIHRYRPAFARPISIVRKRRERQRATFVARASRSRFFKPAIVICVCVAVSWVVPFGLAAVSEWQGRWFGSHLLVGMSHRQVDDLRRASGGSPPAAIFDRDPSTAHVVFAPSIWPCYVAARVYALTFDARDRLATWERDTWGNGC